MKKNIFILFFILLSCNNYHHCLNNNEFDIYIEDFNIDSINKKKILNEIINNSKINIKENSNLVIKLNIYLKKKSSLVSINNTTEIESLKFIVRFDIFDKELNKIIYSDRIIIIDNLTISDNRFSNFALNEYILTNFSKNFSTKLENKIEYLINNKNCKIFKN